ncbi:hypothetical protein GOBAR_AA05876 [Gossypium barbadense]|uniref:TLC domain-containing protein n=1 Tax=Gossypium barbadense TaxID=3634 RepID=A0A2P5YGH8_GOSBA|nr:hypothetical protein GOBAR_AA05876 [Gossypium barbadense]
MPPTHQSSSATKVSTFFSATLLLWVISVFFQILFNKRRDLLYIFAGGCFYQFANWVIRFSVSRDPLFVNTSVSLLHSAVTSVSVVFILLNQWSLTSFKSMFEHKELVEGTWPWAYQALCFSCGYFAYDQQDMLQYRLYSGFIPSILIHHLVLLICFTLALYRHITINYLILTLICEACYSMKRGAASRRRVKSILTSLMCCMVVTKMGVWDMSQGALNYQIWRMDLMKHNFLKFKALSYTHLSNWIRETLHSVFLHVRKLRRMAGVRDAESRVVKVEWILNWIMFVFTRLVSHILITGKLIKDASKFEKGIEWPLAMLGMAGMNLLNAFLGIDLFNAFKKEKKPQQNNPKRHE